MSADRELLLLPGVRDDSGGGGPIGRGRFAEVWLGREQVLGRLVAVKRLVEVGPDTLTAFFAAAKVVEPASRHPAVVTLLGAGVDDGGVPYLVMPYQVGGSLEQRLMADGRLTMTDAVHVARRLGGGLAALHEVGQLHTDVRPANVLLDQFGRPQLADAGLSALWSRAQGRSRAESAPGVLAHLPPEVIDASAVGPPADVYGLAATLYTLLAGRPPFTHGGVTDPSEIVARIQEGDMRDLRTDGLPDSLWSVLCRALDPDPLRRTQHVGELVEGLRPLRTAPSGSHQRPPGTHLDVPQPEQAPLPTAHLAEAVPDRTPQDTPTGPPVAAAAGAGRRWVPAVLLAVLALLAAALLLPRLTADDKTATTSIAPVRASTSEPDAGGVTSPRLTPTQPPQPANPDAGVATPGRIPHDGPLLPPLDGVSSLAGEGLQVGGSADRLRLARPEGVAFGAEGEYYAVDRASHRVYRVDGDGTVHIHAGAGRPGYAGDGGRADEALLHDPHGVAFHQGSLYITDRGNGAIRRVDPTGTISTLAGGGGSPLSPEQPPQGVAVAADGTVYATIPATGQVVAVDVDGTTTVLAGNGSRTSTGDGGPAAQAGLDGPTGVAVDGDDVLVAELGRGPQDGGEPTGRIRRLLRDPGGTWTIRAEPAGDGLDRPEGIAVAPDGAIVVSSTFANQVLRVEQGAARVVAGDGEPASAGDGQLAIGASLERPRGVAVAADGSMLIAEGATPVVRRVTPRGVIDTAVGRADMPREGPPASLGLTLPNAVAAGADGEGGLVVADLATAAVLEITGGLARDRTSGLTQVTSPGGLALDPAGTIYIADTTRHAIYALSVGGELRIVAGQPGLRAAELTEQTLGDGVPAVEALLNFPRGLAWADGTLYIADQLSHRIRAVGPDGLIRTVIGSGTQPGLVDGPARQAVLDGPADVAVDGTTLLVADTNNHALRRLDLAAGLVTTVRGEQLRLASPLAVDIDQQGRIAIADTGNGRVLLLQDGVTATILGTDQGGLAHLNPVDVLLQGNHVVVADPSAQRVWAAPIG